MMMKIMMVMMAMAIAVVMRIKYNLLFNIKD